MKAAKYLLVCCFGVSLACSTANHADSDKAVAISEALTAGNQSLSTQNCVQGAICALEMVLPSGVAPGAPWVAARNKVTIGDQVQLLAGAVATVGTGGVFLGTDVTADTVISQGTVQLRDRAKITGQLVSPVVPVLGNQNSIPNSFTPSPVTPNGSYLLAFGFPPSNASNQSASSGQVVPISPGVYGDLIVQNGGKVTLSAGSYVFRSVQVEPDGHVSLPSQHVLVNIAKSMTLRGKVEAQAGTYDWTVVYGSADPLIIEQGFTGTLVAPRATLTLRGSPARYVASVYASELTIEAGASFTYLPSQVPTISRSDCYDTLMAQQPQTDNTTVSKQAAFDALRFCQAPGIPECYGAFVAALNSQRYAAAMQYAAKTIGTSDHLAITRDRSRKARQMRKDPARLASYCIGDADDDLVPDSLDKCPNTPPLTPTDDNGCTSTAPKPVGPPRAAVDNILASMGILHNPACDGSGPPVSPGYLDPVIYISNGCPSSSVPSFLNYELDHSCINCSYHALDETCPVWYEVRATTFSPAGKATYYHFSLPLKQPYASANGRVAYYSNKAPSLPAQFYSMMAGLVLQSKVYIETRAIDGNGRYTAWSSPTLIQPSCSAQ